jgi:hypothetical protein
MQRALSHRPAQKGSIKKLEDLPVTGTIVTHHCNELLYRLRTGDAYARALSFEGAHVHVLAIPEFLAGRAVHGGRVIPAPNSADRLTRAWPAPSPATVRAIRAIILNPSPIRRQCQIARMSFSRSGVLIPTASGRGAFATELLVQNYNRRSILSTKMRFVRIITLLIVPPVAFRLAAIRAPKPAAPVGINRWKLALIPPGLASARYSLPDPALPKHRKSLAMSLSR